MSTVSDVLALFGFLFRFLGFLVAGYAVGRFVFDTYKTSEWQVRIALALGFFVLFIGVTAFAGPASSGAFALASGIAWLYPLVSRKAESKEEIKPAG